MAKWSNIPQITYSSSDIKLRLLNSSETKLDALLRKRWERAKSLKIFRYALNIQATKVLPGKYGFFAQLNEERGSLRRKPQEIRDINAPFNPMLFNFTRLKEEEILFTMNLEGEAGGVSNYVAINDSPIDYGHCLLLPALEKCHPQVISEDGLSFAINFLLLSGSLDLRIGFNGLCAFASVNHLHYHAYYLSNRMLLERIEVHHLKGPCYELTDYPGEGFAFQLSNQDVDSLVRNVFTLTSYLQEKGIAHNLYITRGSEFQNENKHDSSADGSNIVRVYVWARKPSYGAKEVKSFYPALCELFGHFPLTIRSEGVAAYDNITEEFISSVLYDICHEVFLSIRDEVAKLYN
ncbi:GDP-D-glucose phosphorylase 1 [Ischnura elegans]|uniref:GDP-D-glucose phosphorylase 1 n=1 Tax=Ischnura elegans TaxID=197161 RepID=UPI001ED867B4|nr:GDP-D-glucose phosphorylase 1 [Ischnura elegans]XP_046383658.1 GDP-D-glucose phosphorylase 1 [Ischnura elegans]